MRSFAMPRLKVLGGDRGAGDAGLVLAGGGAGGAYTAGALSVLLPRLGDQLRVVVGSSVGALSAAYLAADWDRRCNESPNGLCQLWRELRFRDVIAPLTSPGGVWRLLAHVGGLMPIAAPRQPSVFDCRPLARTLPDLISFERLNANLTAGRLTLAVMATCAHDHRPRVFYQGATPPVSSDRVRGIDYEQTEPLALEHVLASGSIPALLPAVHIRAPERAAGWYYDGAPTLNTPIKPALWLGAKRVIVIALNSIGPQRATNQPRPDLFTGAFQFLHGALGDPVAQDIRTLAHTNTLLTGHGHDLDGEQQPRSVPYIFIAPQDPTTIGQLATRIWREHYARPARSGQRRDLWLLGRLLDAGASARRGELLSYLFFAPEFAEALIELGCRDAQRWLESHPADPWRVDPLPAWTQTRRTATEVVPSSDGRHGTHAA
jgi:NTE family protein